MIRKTGFHMRGVGESLEKLTHQFLIKFAFILLLLILISSKLRRLN